MNSPTDNFKPIIPELLGEAAFVYVAKANELIRKGHKVISFSIGQPDIPTFQHIVDSAKEALDKRFTGYTETAGIYELREAISNYLNSRYSSDVRPTEVIVTPGAKGAIFLAISSYIGPGDEVIVPEPSFPAYSEVTRFMGGKPIFVPLKWLGQEKGFSLDLERIESSITNRTKMIILNNPHNPTGALFTEQEVVKLYEIAKENNLILLADEIYDNFIYDNLKFKSILSEADWRSNILYINGFSKTFSMTGWRLGYLVVKEELAQKLTRFAVNIYSCPTSFAQKAAVVALTGSWAPVKEMVALFQKRRDLMAKLLSKVPGFEVWPSKGAFYMFPNISEFLEQSGLSTEAFVEYLIEKYKVITLPGACFPDKAGSTYIRFSFASSFEAIEEGIKRIYSAANELLKK
ncbi:MAG: pyridoxal phosphate-dependent aminotransferase [Nitrososphaeria archaeon]